MTEEYTKKVLSQAQWINAEFLEDVLSSTLGEQVKVVDYLVMPAVGVGDNYFGILYKTKVDYTVGRSEDQQTRNLMVKGVPDVQLLLEMIEAMGIFQKEIMMYKKTLPTMQDDPDQVMTVANEFYGKENRERMEPFLEMTMSVLTSAVQTWGENARFAEPLKKISHCIWEKMDYMANSANFGFNVLNHGDLWVNNVMFKYDEDGSLMSAKLVDFQMSRYTTPAMDLQYFFSTSPQSQTLCDHLQDMLSAYHQALTADLAMLGVEVEYTIDQLSEDMLDTATYGVLTMAQILPIIVAPPSEVFEMGSMDPEEIANSEDPEAANPMTKNYQNVYYRTVAGKYLCSKDTVGYLDAAVERMKPVVEAAEAERQQKEERQKETAAVAEAG